MHVVRSAPHRVQFYEDDAFLVESVGRFIGAALGAGDAAVVIATPAHRPGIDARLSAHGIDVAAARAGGRYVSVDAAETLATFMVDGMPDEQRFVDVVGGIIARIVARHPGLGVCAFGEMVALLYAQGNGDAALRLEQLWNGLAQQLPFSLLCAYPIDAFDSEAHHAPFLRICSAHSDVIPAESYMALDSEDERLRVVTQLQQKASALDTEIRERAQAEEAAHERNRTLQALVASSPVPIVVIDPDTTVRLWNPAAQRVFGWSEQEVIGRPLPMVPPEKLSECARVRDALVRGESFVGVETYRMTRDGRIIDLRISSAPLAAAGGVVRSIVLLFEDVTERNRIEAARQKALRELARLYEMGKVLSAELDLQRLLQAVTDAAAQLSGAEFGAFLYNAVDDRGGRHVLYALSGASREEFEAFGSPRETAMFGQAFAGEGVIRLDDVSKDPRYGSDAPHRGIPIGHLPVTSYLAVPVIGRGGAVVGGIFLGHPDPAVFGEDAERVVVGLAAQAAIAVDNARLYERERTARADAETANRAKDEFLAMLSHELRNPLAAVQNALVTARLDSTRRDRAIEIAGRQSDQLARLVDDLLDVARITQGKITLRMNRVRFASIVERAVETSRPCIQERAHIVTVSSSLAEVHVEGDPTRLEQVVVNLLNNAAKYTEPGGRIEVSTAREGADVVLRVRDNGVGIAPHVLPRIFDLFAQAERGLDRAQGGLGIGLTVVRRLVEMHGGRVHAHSAGVGQGAEFVVCLPALPAQSTEIAATPSQHAHGTAHVLLVEDNADLAESMTMLMELLGHRVEAVAGGEEALRLARAMPPDVMLVDIGLPGIDGYEVARRVRRDPALNGVILVALTGYGRDEDRRDALAAGFDHHLAKPVAPDALHALVARIAKTVAPATSSSTLH